MNEATAQLQGSGLPVTEACLGSAPEFPDAPEWIYGIDNPYLHGAYAPMATETPVIEIEVEGEFPKDLRGSYFRNGTNPMYPPAGAYHPFDGDGMVHGVHVREEGVFYLNRWVNTTALQEEQAEGRSLSPGVMGRFDFERCVSGIKDTSNTDLFALNGDLVSLWYNAGHPMSLDPWSLETRGAFELTGRATQKMSAHSKVDWRTGELIYFDYSDQPPYFTYGVADRHGKVIHEVPIDLPGARLPHDIGFTEHFSVLHDLPFYHDPEVLQRHGRRVLAFHRDTPTRFGIIPRFGNSGDVRWFECEPCYILHVSNCWEEGPWVVMDGCRSVNPMPNAATDEGPLSHMLAYMRLEANNYRWRFNLETGEVREGDIDDLNTEFNKINPLFGGVPSRYAWHQRIPLAHEGGAVLWFSGLVKYDNQTGRRWQWDYGDGVFGSEAVFAPRQSAGPETLEDDGYVVNFVTDTRDWQSWFQVFDARDIERGPVARAKMPHRVPAGFHALWVPA